MQLALQQRDRLAVAGLLLPAVHRRLGLVEQLGTLVEEDLQQPWISSNRETYRRMREESNDAFEKRDRLIYVNIGLRVFSVLQVAYLQGLFGGGPKNEMQVAGHKVEIIAEPRGFTSSRLGAIVSF